MNEKSQKDSSFSNLNDSLIQNEENQTLMSKKKGIISKRPKFVDSPEVSDKESKYHFKRTESEDFSQAFANHPQFNQPQNIQQNRKTIFIVQAQSCLDLDELYNYDEVHKLQQIPKRLTISGKFRKLVSRTYIDEKFDEKEFYSGLPGYFTSYLILQSIFIGAITVPWNMSIKSDSVLRFCWRYIFQTLMIIPFVLYEYRIGDQSVKEKYKWRYILTLEYFRKLLITSINNSFHIFIILKSGQFTFSTNAQILGNLQNFWLSLQRVNNGKEICFVEKVGQIMCIIGVLIISIDIFLIDNPNENSGIDEFRHYLQQQPWQRVLFGSILPILSSFIMINISQTTSDIKLRYPPFLAQLIISALVSFNFFLYSFLFDGTNVSFDPYWGFLGIFQDDRITEYLLMGTVINLSMLLSQQFISKIFEPLVPASATLLEAPLNATLQYFLDFQYIPGAVTIIGYLLVQPGLFNILIGQDIQRQINEHKEKRKQSIERIFPSEKQLEQKISIDFNMLETYEKVQKQTLGSKGRKQISFQTDNLKQNDK